MLVRCLFLVLVATGGLTAASRCVVEAYFGYGVVEDRQLELPELRTLLRAEATRQGLGVIEAPGDDDPAPFWLAHAVIGWRGTGADRRLVLTLEVERIAPDGVWWNERVELPQGYAREAAVGAFGDLLRRARAVLPGM